MFFTYEDAFEAGQWLNDRKESKEERSEWAVQTKLGLVSHRGFFDSSVVHNPPAGGNGNPLQYSCLENFMDRGAWHITGPQNRKQLNATEHEPVSHSKTFRKVLTEAHNS